MFTKQKHKLFIQFAVNAQLKDKEILLTRKLVDVLINTIILGRIERTQMSSVAVNIALVIFSLI